MRDDEDVSTTFKIVAVAFGLLIAIVIIGYVIVPFVVRLVAAIEAALD